MTGFNFMASFIKPATSKYTKQEYIEKLRSFAGGSDYVYPLKTDLVIAQMFESMGLWFELTHRNETEQFMELPNEVRYQEDAA